MMIHIPGILSPEQVQHFQAALDAADWRDGAETAGYQSALAKANQQLAEGGELARRLGGEVEAALGRNAAFFAAALPARVYPPLFNRYGPGESFGIHVDNAVRQLPGRDFRVRCDVSATLFLNAPETYAGGELIVEDTYGEHAVKLAAGDMILYPSSSLHRVTPVTRGARLAAFFWIQSLVRDVSARTSLYQMDSAIQSLSAEVGVDHPALVQMTAVYHNLLRRWSDV